MTIIVRTRNTIYTIAQKAGGTYTIHGNRGYCPTPTYLCGTMPTIKMGERMRYDVGHPDGTIVSSPVEDITIVF